MVMWVFGYGSLVWNPGFEFDEKVIGFVKDYKRVLITGHDLGIGFALMISSFISNSSSATIVGFSVFIVGFLTQLVTTFGFSYSKDFSKTYRVIWSLFPPNLLAKALNLIGEAIATSEDPGIRWSRRAECPPNELDCVITIDTIYKWLVSTFFAWILLAIYFDNIIPNQNGVRKSLFYFLNHTGLEEREEARLK